MVAALDQLLVIAERALSNARVAHALIGGCARNVYAAPRATRDVDLAVIASAIEYQEIAANLRSLGFTKVTEVRADMSEALPDVALFSDDTGGRIDLLLAQTDFERRAVGRARLTSFPNAGIVVPVVRVEDLVVYKALAGRPRDIMDIEDIVRSQTAEGGAVDWAYIESECAKWEASAVVQAIRERIR